jgi:formylglycine-generating enzyme required for sulfatase activity
MVSSLRFHTTPVFETHLNDDGPRMTENPNCCRPARNTSQLAGTTPVFPAARSAIDFDTATIPAGRGFLGTDHAHIKDDGESPLRRKQIKAFQMARTTVTNNQFEAFVEATGYVTEAEEFGWSFVFWSDIDARVGPTQAVPNAEWWHRVDGANWRDINGAGTQEQTWFANHPVVQVSLRDAQAYASWVGGRLPTEAEWEHAARGGSGDVKFPWGDDEPDDARHLPCNIWQGRFPQTNTGTDGYLRTAPAQSFSANGYGLFNMVGNVWEWTSDAFHIRSLKKSVKLRLAQMNGFQLSKGGSFLCHKSYCFRYRIAARSGTSPDSATPHQGFRVVWDS